MFLALGYNERDNLQRDSPDKWSNLGFGIKMCARRACLVFVLLLFLIIIIIIVMIMIIIVNDDHYQ